MNLNTVYKKIAYDVQQNTWYEIGAKVLPKTVSEVIANVKNKISNDHGYHADNQVNEETQ